MYLISLLTYIDALVYRSHVQTGTIGQLITGGGERLVEPEMFSCGYQLEKIRLVGCLRREVGR